MRWVIGTVIMGIALGAFAQQQPKLEGIWEGSLTIQAVRLRLAFHISKLESGQITGTFDSIDQGARGIPLTKVEILKNMVTIECGSIGMKFEGTMDNTATTIDGNLKHGPGTYPLILKKVEKLTELKRPQEPKKPYPYLSEDFVYRNTMAGIELGATLTVPKGVGSFPAVILITGSGAQDRDESILGHKPFLVLSDYLTRRGIVVLRVDDRGVGKSGGDPMVATSADYANDVEAGIEFLKSRSEIDPKRIGLIGHSEGGIIATIIGARSSDVAFMVFMAGPGVSGLELISLQTAEITRAMGGVETAHQVAIRRTLFETLVNEPDLAKAKAKMRALIMAEIEKLSPAEKTALGSADAAADSALMQIANPWMKFFLTYDPRPDLKKIKVPVLAINGSKDLQVIASQNLPAITAALKAGGNSVSTTKELDGLNHLFQRSKTGLPTEYGDIEETMNQAALDAIGDWIVRVVGKG